MSEGFRAPDGPDPGESRLHFRLRQALDALVYGVAFTLVTLLLGVVVGFGLGLGWFGVELFLFAVGVALLGYASFQLRPAKRWDVEFEDDGFRVVRPDEGSVVGDREESRFQRIAQRVHPVPSLRLTPAQRLSPAAKLLVASVLVLVASILLEAVLFW